MTKKIVLNKTLNQKCTLYFFNKSVLHLRHIATANIGLE